ncbi:MAG TPA: FtsX-like permease family protein, partial [Vicinamibacterales bacterium]|nr:FtsX-like permease family protein [Vicinamibacterales bacterium]
NRGQGSNIVPLTEAIVGGIRPMLIVLLIGAALLLLIASVNVAGLLLVRAEGRRREIAVRSALGASRARVAAQFVTEGAVLVAAGGVLGLAAAKWGIGLLQDLIPADVLARMTYLQGVGLNIRVVAFACGIALLAAILFAAIPLLHVRTASSRALAEGGRGSAGLGWRRLGARMVVVELATAMVLLTAAGLLGRSLNALLRVDVGLRPDGLATLQLTAPDRKYSDNAQIVAFQREVEQSIAALPGVTQVGVSSRKPLAGGNTMWIRVLGRPYHGEHNEVHYREVSPGYFPALGAQLVRGRGITEADDVTGPAVVVVNEALVRTYFPNEDPLGQHLAYPDEGSTPMEIVGIVRDIKEAPLDEATPPTIYVAFAQDPTSGFTVFARTSVAPSSLVPAMTDAVKRIDPDVTTFQGRTMEDAINDSPPAYLRRSVASLVGSFAAVAWVLGLIGLYGVIAYSVSQRTREIGVRVALGARPGSVYRLILREAGLVIGIGLAAGALFAVFGATLMHSLLFGVTAWDAPTLAAVGVTLGVSALLASAVPARRAASVDPVDALRAE